MTEVQHAEDEELPHLNNSPPELARATEVVAGLAYVPTQQHPLFCDWLCYCVQMVGENPTRAVSSKPSRALIKAAEAAQTLNEAVCSLNKVDRKWVDELVAHDPRLCYEERLLRSTEGFQTDQLHRTVFLLDYLFNTVIGKSPPILSGTARLSMVSGPKKGTVKNPTFHNFVWSLLTGTAEFGGRLSLNKNRNEKEGTLVRALDILRDYLPSGVIPYDLRPHRSTLQRIRTEHSKARRRGLENPTKKRRAPLDQR